MSATFDATGAAAVSPPGSTASPTAASWTSSAARDGSRKPSAAATSGSGLSASRHLLWNLRSRRPDAGTDLAAPRSRPGARRIRGAHLAGVLAQHRRGREHSRRGGGAGDDGRGGADRQIAGTQAVKGGDGFGRKFVKR